jgi:hypothetical protein
VENSASARLVRDGAGDDWGFLLAAFIPILGICKSAEAGAREALPPADRESESGRVDADVSRPHRASPAIPRICVPPRPTSCCPS